MKINISKFSKVTEKEILKLAILCMCISSMLQSSLLFQSWNLLIDLLKYAVLLFAALIIFIRIKKQTKLSYILKILILGLLVLITCLKTKNYSYMIVCIIILLSKKIEIKEYIKICYWTLLAFGGGQIIIWCLNYIFNFGYPVYYNVYEQRISFLFTHPNIATIKLGWGMIMYSWLKYNNLNWKKILGCFAYSFLLYYTTKSDSCLFLILYCIFLVFRKSKLFSNVTILISRYCFFLLGILNYLLAIWYVQEGTLLKMARLADVLSSRRIAMAYLALKNNGISYIGKTIDVTHEWEAIFNFGNYTIDSLYIYFFVCIGIVYFILISYGFYKLGKYNSYKVAIVIITFSLFAFIELHVLYIANCFALLLLKCVIFKDKQVE